MEERRSSRHSSHHHHHGHHHHHHHHNSQRQKIYRKRIIGSVVVCVVVLAVAFFGIYRQLQNQKSMEVKGTSNNTGSGYRDIVYKGEKYRYNNRVTTILYAGIDSTGKMEAKPQYGNKARADSIALIVMDEKKGKTSVVFISRDTMTKIHRYSLNGSDQGYYETHLAYAYSYGDGGEVSCNDLCEAVSTLFGGVPIKRYVVTNQDSMPYINDLAGGITLTVPNDDLVEQYPEFYEGAEVTLTDETVTPFLHYRDVNEDFSNDGRMERHKAYASAYLKKMKSLNTSQIEEKWTALDQMSDYLQTNITKSQYLELAQLLKNLEFSDDDFLKVQGQDKQGELHDEFYVDEDALQELIIDLFYNKV